MRGLEPRVIIFDNLPLVKLMELSVVIPAYNEASRIERSLKHVRAYLERQGRSAEVIVVDDGSTDGTAAAVQRTSVGFPELKLIRLPRHWGKGAAVRAGMLAASGSRLLMSDADLSTPLEELERFEQALDNGADIVIGSRQTTGARVVRHQPWVRQQAGLVFGRLTRRLIPLGITDTQCGFKLFRAEPARIIFARQRLKGFCFDIEVLALARELGFQVVELPVTWSNDPESKVKMLRHLPQVGLEIAWLTYQSMSRRRRAASSSNHSRPGG